MVLGNIAGEESYCNVMFMCVSHFLQWSRIVKPLLLYNNFFYILEIYLSHFHSAVKRHHNEGNS